MLRRTTIVVAALAAGLVPAAAAAAQASPHQLLHDARAGFSHHHRTAKPRDLSAVLQRLAIELPRLHGSERTQAARLLARPTDGAADPDQNGYSVPEASGSPFCSAHYCIHWVASGPDAPDLTDADGNGIPDWVETVDATAENVYSVENDQLGWRPPKGDGSLGGHFDLTDIYLKDVAGSGVYGYTAPDTGQQTTRTNHSEYAYLVIDNDFAKSQFPQYTSPVVPLDVTLAHEYNHVLQYDYDALQDTWMFEATAVWMEGKVYDAPHDYLQYLPGWVALSALPITRFDGNNPNDRNNVKVYGSSVWNKWLDQRYGQDIVRNAWEGSLSTRPQSYAPAAYDAAIRQHGGPGFSAEFARFAGATAEWQAQNSGFPEGGLYPDVRRAGTLAVNGSAGTIPLDHTAFAIANIPATNASRIKLAMSAPAGTYSALALVGRTGPLPGGTMTELLQTLPKGGGGTLVLDNPGGFTRLSAVLINADTQESGFSQRLGDWVFKHDAEPFFAHVSTDFSPPHVRGETPRSGSRGVAVRHRIAVTFSEPVTGVTTKTFELIGPGGRVVKTRLKFKSGSRKATLVPRRGLRRGAHYVVRVSTAITDLSLNRLSRAPGWSFTAG